MSQEIDFIKYEGDSSAFIWKHPCETISLNSKLIVSESQEAVLFVDGKVLETFNAGSYILRDLDSINKLVDDYNSIETFHIQIFFINKILQMGLKWGTDTRVRYIEPAHGMPIELGASGEMNLQIIDSTKVINKLVGSAKSISWEESGEVFTRSLQNSFKPFISTSVKSHLSRVIKDLNINILEVDEHLEELSIELKKAILPGFKEFGLDIPQFYLSRVIFPEDDANFKRLRSLYAVGIKKEAAKAEVEVTIAEREVEIEKQVTKTEIAKREAERKLINARADAEVARLSKKAETVEDEQLNGVSSEPKDKDFVLKKASGNSFKIWSNPNTKTSKSYKSKIKES